MNPEYFLKSYEHSMYALKLERSDREFIQAFFANYSLSPTDLTRFLNSPEEFLQRSILRYPFEDTLKTLFGICYHGALEVFYKTWKLERSRPACNLLEDTFTQKLGRYRLSELENADALERGIAGLQGFYELTSQSDVLPLELEYSTSRLALHFEGIPIKGKIDRIDEISPGKLRIVDYKTGNPKSENALMGKTATADVSYLRQLLFYKLMIESDPRWSGYTVDEIAIWYVEGKEGKYPLQILTITDEIEAQFRLDLHAAWAQITSIDWWMSYF
jgi:RecB family exonuclease